MGSIEKDAEGRFFDALYRGVTDSEKFGDALRTVQDMFGCRGAVLVAVDAQDPAANLVFTAGLMMENLQAYFDKYSQIDPAPARYLQVPVGKAVGTDRLFTPEELEADRFFVEFFRPMGLVETLGGTLYAEQGNFSMIALMRGVERRQFDDDDSARLERLMPHIARAVQLRRTFLRIDAKNMGLQATANRLSAGLVLLNEEGASIYVNAAMQAIAQRSDGLSLDRRGSPMPINIEARRRFDVLLKDVNGGGPGGILTVERTGMRSYVVMIAPSPMSAAQSEWERRGPVGAIVLVHDPETGERDAAEILERGLGLSKGAARVTAALAAADDLKSFADREGVTIHTARFHLRSALSRTGARSQAELVRLAVRLLRDVALSRPDD